MAQCNKCKREIEHRKEYKCRVCGKVLCTKCNSDDEDIIDDTCLKCEVAEMNANKGLIVY